MKGALPPFVVVGPIDWRPAIVLAALNAVTNVDSLYTDPRHQDEKVDPGIPTE